MSCFHQSATYTPEQEQPNIFEIPNKAKLADSDSEDDLLDDQFLEQYRAQRLDALQSAVHRLFPAVLPPIIDEINHLGRYLEKLKKLISSLSLRK